MRLRSFPGHRLHTALTSLAVRWQSLTQDEDGAGTPKVEATLVDSPPMSSSITGAPSYDRFAAVVTPPPRHGNPTMLSAPVCPPPVAMQPPSVSRDGVRLYPSTEAIDSILSDLRCLQASGPSRGGDMGSPGGVSRAEAWKARAGGIARGSLRSSLRPDPREEERPQTPPRDASPRAEGVASVGASEAVEEEAAAKGEGRQKRAHDEERKRGEDRAVLVHKLNALDAELAGSQEGCEALPP